MVLENDAITTGFNNNDVAFITASTSPTNQQRKSHPTNTFSAFNQQSLIQCHQEEVLSFFTNFLKESYEWWHSTRSADVIFAVNLPTSPSRSQLKVTVLKTLTTEHLTTGFHSFIFNLEIPKSPIPVKLKGRVVDSSSATLSLSAPMLLECHPRL